MKVNSNNVLYSFLKICFITTIMRFKDAYSAKTGSMKVQKKKNKTTLSMQPISKKMCFTKKKNTKSILHKNCNRARMKDNQVISSPQDNSQQPI